MKKIKLTNSDKEATVDNEDYEYINQWDWFLKKEGDMEYAARISSFDGVKHIVYMHDEVMGLMQRRNKN